MPRWIRRHGTVVLLTLTSLSLLVATSSAGAQSSHPPDVRYRDAHVDRVVLSPTAETHPEGTYFGSLYYILPQVGYAPTQRLQLSLTGFTTFDGNFIFELTAKANLVRTRTLRVATITSLDVLSADETSLAFGRVGATVQWCFTETCESSVNASGMVVVHDKADLLVPYGGAIGFIGHLSGMTKLLLEYGTLASLTESFLTDVLKLWYVGYGLRFSRASWAFDVVLLKQLAMKIPENRRDGPNLGDVIGLPLLVFTYRFGHD